MGEHSEIKFSEEVSSYIFYGSDLLAAYRSALDFANGKQISHFDTIEIEPESGEGNSKPEIKIRAIRELIRQINLTPGHGQHKLAIIKDADKLNIEAANTLLKTLEEPPATAKIILLSRNMKLLPTIRSRCQIIRLKNRGYESTGNEKEFEKIISGSLKQAFKYVEEMMTGENLEEKIDGLICELRQGLTVEKNISLGKKLKLLILAKNNLRMTTNKRLVLENLVLRMREV